eukprot:gnl/TRDRNA2_/TRDRNA2_186276_c0_seq1.p1 gnl/TRDRNA2_/TRDRNA2_186276_c0~~gnl/TRDRNA2_/TRDRNA2_186276_c0_seq1.p1  ORF type:complete len:578 (-),score=145.19 gnl/TRDRNA2_/TRDRNA2_186276_c0_seq1:29-1762(-)
MTQRKAAASWLPESEAPAKAAKTGELPAAKASDAEVTTISAAPDASAPASFVVVGPASLDEAMTLTCNQHHPLRAHQERAACDSCHGKQEPGVTCTWYGCRVCNYDICSRCAEQQQAAEKKRLAEEAELWRSRETEMRVHIQAMLIDADLAEVTVGQLRVELARRMSLTPGALDPKRIRRRVNQALQHAVSQKLQRSADCEVIVRALIGFGSYPASSRQMLIESLPHALPRSGDAEPQHAHQQRFLEIVREALDDARRSAATTEEAAAAALAAARQELLTSQASLDTASKEEAAARVAARDATAALAVVRREVQEAEAERRSAKSKRVDEDITMLQVEEARRLLNDQFRLLAEGAWQNDAERNKAVADVHEYLGRMGCDQSMLAATTALASRPDARSNFEQVIVGSFEERLSQLADPTTAERNIAEAETALLAAEAMLEAQLAQEAQLAAAETAALAAVPVASAALVAARKRLEEQAKNADARAAERVCQQRCLAEVDEALAALERREEADEADGDGEGSVALPIEASSPTTPRASSALSPRRKSVTSSPSGIRRVATPVRTPRHESTGLVLEFVTQ